MKTEKEIKNQIEALEVTKELASDCGSSSIVAQVEIKIRMLNWVLK